MIFGPFPLTDEMLESIGVEDNDDDDDESCFSPGACPVQDCHLRCLQHPDAPMLHGHTVEHFPEEGLAVFWVKADPLYVELFGGEVGSLALLLDDLARLRAPGDLEVVTMVSVVPKESLGLIKLGSG